MRKIGLLFTLMATVLVVGCTQNGSITSTTSYLKVIEKQHSSNYKEAWIMAYNPSTSKEKDVIKIIVKDPMVWNLIEKDKEYFSSYSKKGENPWVLGQISYPGDGKALR